ncbi:burhizin family lasso peptide [Mycoavidus cysteinexigens]|nr:burhizin family lasso peptide [Mycoavidus cysteinexigens]
MTNSKENKIQEIQLQDETLSEFCASEATMGGSGQYREAGVGRFL